MREFAAALMLFAVAKSAAGTDATNGAIPAQTAPGGSKVARLEDQLLVGLRATRTDQRTFLRKIAEHVEKGAMERARVLAIYEWAITRNGRYPFPYFERAMRLDAKKLGIELPEVQIVIQTFSRAG